MISTRFGFNESALKLVNKLIDDADKYLVKVDELSCGAKLIDAGIIAEGGFQAGEIV